jgi:hypothetical protein
MRAMRWHLGLLVVCACAWPSDAALAQPAPEVAAPAPEVAAPAPEVAAPAPEVAAPASVIVAPPCSKPPHSAPGAAACVKRAPPATDEVPDVASLKTPESPAFMVLGVAPSEIQRPSTPTGLKASFSNGLAAGGSLPLLQSFALEVSPFWLFPHHDLSYEDVVREPSHAIYRNIALSLATSPEEVEIEDEDGTERTVELGRIAAGARVTLWPGVPTRGAERCRVYIKDQLEQRAAQLYDPVLTFKNAWELENPEPAQPSRPKELDDPSASMEAIERATAEYEAADKVWAAWSERRNAAANEHGRTTTEAPPPDAAFSRCLHDIHARKGFMAETAAAYMLAAPDGDLDQDSRIDALTAWLTLGVVFEDFAQSPTDPTLELSVLGVGRVQSERGSAQDPEADVLRLDVGARFAVALARYGLALEGTYRRQERQAGTDASQLDHLWRIAVSLDYRLDGGIWLSGTFGKDFGDTEKDTPILALANLQWNFDIDRGVQPDREVTR